MNTVKQVAKLTGVSVRTLQYYDEIGVLKPTYVSAAGYRFYDDEALKKLQQILLFKELDFKLKEIKSIMENPHYDRISIFRKQKDLIKAKRDRLERLIGLLDKLEKGDMSMSFKEFDMSEYLSALEQFKQQKLEDVIKYFGSLEEFDKFIDQIKINEEEVAKLAIKQYGSIEKYTEVMKEQLSHFSENMEKFSEMEEKSGEIIERNNALILELVSDINKDITSKEIQSIVHKLVKMSEENTLGMDMGENFWNMVIEGYFEDPTIIKHTDDIYGAGAAEFIGRAYQYYFKGDKR